MKDWKLIYIIPLILLFTFSVKANNVRVVEDIEVDDQFPDKIATVNFKIAWDNSWRDNFNWDAVYVFLKYKKKSEVEWKHAFIMDNEHSLSQGFSAYAAKTATTHRSMGIYIQRNANGNGDARVSVGLKWRIDQNGLVATDFLNDEVELQATCIEMIYYPLGAFCLGDGASDQSFRKEYRPILPEWDVLKNDGTMTFSSSDDPTSAAYKLYPPSNAVNRVNENRRNYIKNAWMSVAAGSVSWMVDFGENEANWKKILYYGVSGVIGQPGNRPSTWSLQARKRKTEDWVDLSVGMNNQDTWVIENNSYPVQRALEVNRQKADKYRYYQIRVITSSAPVVANNIAMTEVDMAKMTNDAYVMDKAAGIEMDKQTKLSADDADNWVGVLQANYPTGFNGFYAMKYEITQEQWIRFLNKLQYKQQKARTIGNRLDELVPGDYIYGDRNIPTCRNGIAIGARVEGNVVFVNNLNKGGAYSQDDDGQNIACNFLSPSDMLAYADWCGLRPLSEMEYEKMARAPYPAIPEQGEWAAGTKAGVVRPSLSALTSAGTKNERVNDNEGLKVNVNAGGNLQGPIRVGSLAVGGVANQISTGAGFWGAMDLSGNLAEIYYNCTSNQGRNFQDVLLAHGDGNVLTNSDASNPGGTDMSTTYWPQTPGAFILKGGNFNSNDKRLAISDRSANNYYTSITTKDSTVSFRLGRSVTKLETVTNPETFINLNNGVISSQAGLADTVCSGGSYTFRATPVAKVAANTGGRHSFIWYKSENSGTTWDIIRGQEGQDMTYSDFNNDGGEAKEMWFKRKTVTNAWWSETNHVVLRIVNTGYTFNRLKDTITVANHVLGYWVDTKTSASFVWKWKSSQGTILLRAGQKNNIWDFYAPLRRDFKEQSSQNVQTGSQTLVCEINFLGRCVRNQELPLHIVPRPTIGVAPSSIAINAADPKFECGVVMQDNRAGIQKDLYATVKIGNQCWMAENLRFNLPGYTMFRDEDPSGEVLGGFYLGGRPVEQGACPSGWYVPTIDEYNTLISYLDNMGATTRTGSKLKQGAYWHVDLSQKANLGTNESGFGAAGTGYYGGGWKGLVATDGFKHSYFDHTYFGTSVNNQAYYYMDWNSSAITYYIWYSCWYHDGYDLNGNYHPYVGNYQCVYRGWQYYNYYFPIRCIKR